MARTRRKPTAIDLFAGPGGLTLGLRRAGFSVRAAVEVDPLSVATYRANHRGTRVWESDIRHVDPARVADAAGLKVGELDILGACPPCQGFSTTRTLNGSQAVRDGRNALVAVFADWVEALAPKAVLLENVPGLQSNWRYAELLRRLDKLGYPVRTSSGVLDAADYGVPQRRRRLVVMGVRGRSVTFAPPLDRRLTIREVLEPLPRAGDSGDALHDLPERRSSRVMQLIKAVPKDGGSRASLPDDLTLDCHRESDGFKDVYGRMAWDQLAPTITGGCFNPSKGRFLHPQEDRAITLREAAVLQGFPTDYFFSLERGKQAAAAMIGNALPPPFVASQAALLQAHVTGRARHEVADPGGR